MIPAINGQRSVVGLRRRWDCAPNCLPVMDFSHPLSAGFQHRNAGFVVMTASSALAWGSSPVYGPNAFADATGNNNYISQSFSADGFVEEYESIYNGNRNTFHPVPYHGGTVDANWPTQGTIYWSQQPDFAYNAGITRGGPWGILRDNSNNFGSQHFSDNNLYIGWMVSGTDCRVVAAASAYNWDNTVLRNWAFTWKVGAKSQLFVEGVLIATASNTLSGLVDLSSTGTFCVWSFYNYPVDNYTGHMGYFALTAEMHTPDMIAAMADNPYQVLAK